MTTNDIFKLSRNKKTILSVKDQSVKNVVIPEGITAIGRYAFERCESLGNILIPKDTIIGYNAFLYCPFLEDMKLPNHIKSGPF